MRNIDQTLAGRGSSYGDFEENSRVCNELKKVLETSRNFTMGMNVGQIEALYMVCHKMARIVSGDANHVDSWHDIAGYATLGERIAERENTARQ